MTAFSSLPAKARALIDRRDNSHGVAFYWRSQWKRQLLFLSLYAAVIGALFAIQWPIPAAIFLGFAIGKTVRDVQWYRMLACEWPTNAELLDWPKIEALARQLDGPESPALGDVVESSGLTK